jgi:hypothetical protein
MTGLLQAAPGSLGRGVVMEVEEKVVVVGGEARKPHETRCWVTASHMGWGDRETGR